MHHPSPTSGADRPLGALLVVTSPAGAGALLAERAAAAAVAAHPDRSVLLADLTRRAALVRPDGRERPGTGLGALLAVARAARPAPRDVGRATVVHRAGYRVLCAADHPHGWTTVRADAADRAVGSLVAACDLTVAVVDPDLEGEAETGSIDVEERHALARAGVARAHVVAVVDDGTRAGRAQAQAVAHEATALVAPRELVVVRWPPPHPGPPPVGELVARTVAAARAGTVALAPRPIRPGQLGIRTDADR